MEVLSSEQMHWLCFVSYCISLFPMKLLLTSSIRPPHAYFYLFCLVYRSHVKEIEWQKSFQPVLFHFRQNNLTVILALQLPNLLSDLLSCWCSNNISEELCICKLDPFDSFAEQLLSTKTDSLDVYASPKNSCLTLPTPCISESCIKIKINLNFYLQLSEMRGAGSVNRSD